MARVYDIAILGGTPSGYAAACWLARKGRAVTVLDGPHSASECPLTDWAPAGALQIQGLPKSLSKSCQAETFSKVCYHNVSLDKSVQYTSRKTAGVFLHYRKLVKALRSEAERLGAKIRATSTPPAIELQDDQVRLVGTIQVAARLLLIAHSGPNEISADLFSLPSRSALTCPLAVAGLDVPLGRADEKTSDKALHVVELPERTELGMFFTHGSTLHLRVLSNSAAAGTRAEELSEMVGSLQQSGLLPDHIQLGKARGAVWHPPAGLALEMERHVAKRCLLMGTAGGFAESITGQTIRPSLESAVVAAETAEAALNGPYKQSKLATFKSAWRKKQSGYLRPPSTSLHLLLPLLFVNKSIVTRFTRALLYGEPI